MYITINVIMEHCGDPDRPNYNWNISSFLLMGQYCQIHSVQLYNISSLQVLVTFNLIYLQCDT